MQLKRDFKKINRCN